MNSGLAPRGTNPTGPTAVDAVLTGRDIDADPPDINTTDIDYLVHLARDSARFVEVLRHAPAGARVPTCPDWNADDLLWHLTEVQWFWDAIVAQQLTTYPQVKALDRVTRPGRRDELATLFDRTSTDLHHDLGTASPTTPAWAWADDQTVGFIRRRQAHEALIHRLDAELTAGDRTPMDAAVSTDGVDEVLRVMYGRLPSWGRFTPDSALTVRVQTTDTDRAWLVNLGRLTGTGDDGTVHDGPGLKVLSAGRGAIDHGEPAAATVSGAAADLDCWLWHRPTVDTVERVGNPVVLDRLDQAIAVGIQ